MRRKQAETAATRAELREQLRKALTSGKGEVVSGLFVSETAALRERDAADAEYRRHHALAHGAGDAHGKTV